MTKEQVSTIVLKGFIGAILFGLANSCLWYLMIKKYGDPGGFIDAGLGSKLGALLGLVLGLVIGGIVGGIIGGYQIGIVQSFVLGFLVNGLLILLFFTLFHGASLDIFDIFKNASKDFQYIMIGSFIVGGTTGVLLNLPTLFNLKP